MQTSLKSIAVAALTVFAGAAVQAATPYSITGTATYDFGCGPAATASIGSCGGPDTGFLLITNTGSTAFTGSANLFGVAPGQTINLTLIGTLAPGQSWLFQAGPESSNQGGFNKVSGNPDDGLKFSMNGVFGADTFSNAILDKDIHSGVFRINPFGVSLDNYVLQGGDPFGRDTGDAFEVSQAASRFVWASNVPEPSTYALLALGLAGVGFVARRRN